MAERVSNWLGRNKEIIGWVIAAIIYGAGLYQAINQDVVANNKQDAVQQEQINRTKEDVQEASALLEKMNTTLQQVDKNVAEIKTELKYKLDK